MAKMVKPVEVEAQVTMVVRGNGVKVQCEIALETHQRMRLELMRRERQGLPATVEKLLCEIIEREKWDWPMLQD